MKPPRGPIVAALRTTILNPHRPRATRFLHLSDYQQPGIAKRARAMSILEKLTLPEIRELIECKDCDTLREVLSDWQPEDVADLFNDLHPEEDIIVISALDPELAAR